MKVLAIDGSTKSTGVAVFKDEELIFFNCITASSTDTLSRIEKMTKEIRNIYDNFKPDIVIIEEPLPEEINHNQKTFKALMYLQAAIALELHKDKVKLETVVSSEWRRKCGIHTGRGVKRDTLKKADIQFVKDNYNIDSNDDIADAICIGHSRIKKDEAKIIDGFEFK